MAADHGIHMSPHRLGHAQDEVIRCLKRYVAREVFPVIENSPAMAGRVALTSIAASGSRATFSEMVERSVWKEHILQRR